MRLMIRFALGVAFACVLSAPGGAAGCNRCHRAPEFDVYRSSAGHYYRRSPAPRVRRQSRVQVYNPNVYSRTRQTMSSRAAARAALKRKRQRQQQRRRAARARNRLHHTTH